MAKPVQVRIGLAAEFDDAEVLLEAARSLHKAGYRRFESYSPFPIEGLAEAEGFKGSPIGLITLIGGVVGAVTGYGLQVYTNLDFPIDIGGRPLVSPPAFVLITFELMVLFAVTACILAMLIGNRLPKLNHPVFDLERFDLTSLDRFFIVVDTADERYDARRTRAQLKRLGAVALEPLEAWETPS